MKREFRSAVVIVFVFPLVLILFAAPVPSFASGLTGEIWKEDFQSCEEGQTRGEADRWTSSTSGSGAWVRWAVTDIGAIEPAMVFEGSGDQPWEGEWRTETIDISSCREVEISIDVRSEIGSDPANNCYVYFFYQIGTGGPVSWFSQTGTIAPGNTFVRKTSPPVYGDSLVIIFKSSTDSAMLDTYLFNNVRVTGTLPTPPPADHKPAEPIPTPPGSLTDL